MTRKLCTALLLLCMAVPSSYADDPTPAPSEKPTIEVPKTPVKAKLGDYIIIKARTDGVSVTWVIFNRDALNRLPVDEQKDETKLIIVGRIPGKYTVSAVAAGKTGKQAEPVDYVIEIEGTAPLPPEPGPGPILPDGKYKLSKVVYNAVKSTVTNDAERRSVSSDMAGNYTTVVTKINAGVVKTPTEALTEIRALNDATMTKFKVDRAVWDKSANAVGDETLRLYKAGQLVTVDDFKVAFQEITDGFTALSKE